MVPKMSNLEAVNVCIIGGRSFSSIREDPGVCSLVQQKVCNLFSTFTLAHRCAFLLVLLLRQIIKKLFKCQVIIIV